MGLAAAAAIGAVGAIGGGIIASSGAKSAANASAAASDRASQVQQDIYYQNAAALRPYQQVGLPASNAINALLGLGGTTQQQGLPTAQPNQLAAYAEPQAPRGGIYGMTDFVAKKLTNAGITDVPGAWSGASNPGTGYVQTTPPQTSQQAYEDAFANYRNSTGYKFRLGEGMNAINSGYAGRGVLQSGAAMKAINDYGQNMASAEFGNYLNALGNQQALGFSATSAQAGVGQNYANNIGSIAMQNGANQANAALASSQNWANTLGSVGGIAANYLGRSH